MDENEKICSGKENERSNRRYKYIIIIAAIVIVVIGGYIVSLKISEKNYITAKSYEEIYEYENAIEYYKKVFSWDQKYYLEAAKKVKAISEEINKYKEAAKAIVALNNAYNVDPDVIQNVFYNFHDVYFETVIRKYKVSEYELVPDVLIYNAAPYSKVKKDELTGMYVKLYEPEFEYNWFQSIMNEVRDITTDNLYEYDKNSAEEMNLELVMKYYKEYQESGDLGDLDILNTTEVQEEINDNEK